MRVKQIIAQNDMYLSRIVGMVLGGKHTYVSHHAHIDK